MKELTTHELDAQLAEQLPARELMNCYRSHSSDGSFQQNNASQGNSSANGLIAVNALNDDQVNILSAGNTNGGVYQSNWN